MLPFCSEYELNGCDYACLHNFIAKLNCLSFEKWYDKHMIVIGHICFVH